MINKWSSSELFVHLGHIWVMDVDGIPWLSVALSANYENLIHEVFLWRRHIWNTFEQFYKLFFQRGVFSHHIVAAAVDFPPSFGLNFYFFYCTFVQLESSWSNLHIPEPSMQFLTKTAVWHFSWFRYISNFKGDNMVEFSRQL